MGTLPPQKLLQHWAQENMTVEMATGHTLQNLVNLQQAIEALQISLRSLRTDVDSLIAQSQIKPKRRGNLKSPRRN